MTGLLAPQASTGEKAARIGVVVCLVLAVVALAFGVGFLTGDNGKSQTVVNAGSGQTAATSSGQKAASGDSVGAAILDEIFGILKSQYVDKDTINVDSMRAAAIDGVIKSLNDPHTT